LIYVNPSRGPHDSTGSRRDPGIEHAAALDRRRFAKQIRELQEPVVGGNFPPLLGTGCSKRSALALTVGDIKMGSSERAR
jgi:hypothetical protein